MGNGEITIFVVGNSRSGTTMMGRILGASNEIYTLNEIHFFEQLWTPGDEAQLGADSAKVLAARLLSIQRDGYLSRWSPEGYFTEGKQILARISSETDEREFPATLIYRAFLEYETELHGRKIPCDQTPMNLFYLDEIMKVFPNAKVIYMVRDPRDVLLSQKNRWRRKLLGSSKSRIHDMIRDWSNYHPLTISRLWRASEMAAQRFSGHPRVLRVRFEDLLCDPKTKVKEICQFLSLQYDDQMLDIPRVGSSLRKDNALVRGLDPSRIGNWSKKGLSKTEIYLCEKMLRREMKDVGYSLSGYRPNFIKLLYYCFSFPLQIVVALLLNIRRMTNIRQALSRRLFGGYAR